MCLACCDPDKLAKVAPPVKPNCVTIKASSSIVYNTRGDAIVKITGTGHYAGSPLQLEMNRQAEGVGACTWRKQGQASLFIPGPGDWRIYNTGLSDVQVDIFEAYCGAAFAAYAQTGYEGPTHSVITLDATPASTLVLAANRNRAYALFVNDSDTVAYLSFGPAAVVNSGIRLNASGGSYEMEGNTLWRGVVNGIVVGAVSGKKILVTEGI
jgi:hypothetical protein